MKFHIGLASCMILLVVGAMNVPASSSDGLDKGAGAIVSRVATYVSTDNNCVLKLYSDGKVVVENNRDLFWDGKVIIVHGRFVMKNNRLTVTIPKDPTFLDREWTYDGDIANAVVDFGKERISLGWFVGHAIFGKLVKK